MNMNRVYVVCFFVVASAAWLPNTAMAQATWLPAQVGSPGGRPPGELGIEGSVKNPEPLPGVQTTSVVVAEPIFSLTRPANPNLLFGNDLNPTFGTSLGIEGGLPVVYGTATATPQVALSYDTGFVGSGIQMFPSTVALDGTEASRRRGHTQLSAEGTQLAVALVPATETATAFRTDFQLDFFDNVRLRLASGQLALGPGILYGGKTWTTFMDEYAVPISIAANTTAAGTVFRRNAQLGYSFPVLGCWRGFLAVEEPTSTDYTLVAATDQRIQRYPNLVMRLHWADSRDWAQNNTLHIAMLIREMGREDVLFREDFEPGWGVSVMGKVRPMVGSTFYAGAVTGEGIGDSIFGFANAGSNMPIDNMPAAGPDAGELRALTNIGAHAGYTLQWNPGAMTNFGYGYAYAESTVAMPLTAARKLQNAWINHQVKLTEVIAVGFEYHYAVREVRDGTSGDDHRVMFVTQFLTK